MFRVNVIVVTRYFLSVQQDTESIATILHRPKGEKSELNESAQKREGGKYIES